MNIDKYMKKAYGFLAKTPKEQKDKADKLEKIVIKLTLARGELNRDILQTSRRGKREKKQRELQVVSELLKKASKRLRKLTK